jgi:hypothetical protein
MNAKLARLSRFCSDDLLLKWTLKLPFAGKLKLLPE